MTALRIASIWIVLCTLIPPAPHSANASSQTAVLIGIDQYTFHPPLSGSVDDCKALSETLKSRFGFSPVLELYNDRATRGEIIRTLRELTSNMQTGDDLLIVYNGRGYLDTDGGDSDWIAYDTQSETDTIPSELIQTLLRSSELAQALTISTAGFSARSVHPLPLDGTESGTLPASPSPGRRKSRQVLAFNSAESFPSAKANEKGSLVRALNEVLASAEGESITARSVYTRLLGLGESVQKGLVFGTIRNTGDEGGGFIFGSKRSPEGSVSGVVVFADSKLPADGLKVTLQGSDQQGRTNERGEFHFNARPGVYSGLILEGTATEDVAFFPIDLQVTASKDVRVDQVEITFHAKPGAVPPPPITPEEAQPAAREPEPPQGAVPSGEAGLPADSRVAAPTIAYEVVRLDEFGKISALHTMKTMVFREDLGSGVYIDLVPIPGGVYRRGTDPAEEGYQPSEGPLAEVAVAPFYLGVCEITQDQWRMVAALPPVERQIDPDPSYFKGGLLPVEMVTWEDCVEFCLRLSGLTGRPYRLPSEGEWEYACRAGTETPFYFGPTLTTAVANYFGAQPYGAGPSGETRNRTIEAGSLASPNAFGLHDMHGNVSEWCADPWHPSYDGAPPDGRIWETDGDAFMRVLRGGAWRNFASDLRSGERKGLFSGSRYNILGFRVAMDAPPPN